MIKTIDFHKEPHYMTWFWTKSEVSCTLTSTKVWTCDICNKEKRWKSEQHIGVYTGLMDLERQPFDIRKIRYGYKQTGMDVCSNHTEREIERKVKQLIRAEKKNPAREVK